MRYAISICDCTSLASSGSCTTFKNEDDARLHELREHRVLKERFKANEADPQSTSFDVRMYIVPPPANNISEGGATVWCVQTKVKERLNGTSTPVNQAIKAMAALRVYEMCVRLEAAGIDVYQGSTSRPAGRNFGALARFWP
jgi:hypothetical protein